MLVERGYMSTSHNPRQPSRSQGIIHTSLTTRHSTPPTIVRTGGEQRTRDGTRSTTRATQTPTQQPSGTGSPEIVATDQQPQINTEVPESDATAQQPNNITTPNVEQDGTAGVEPEADEWANLAGNARRTGEGRGPAQCTLAAARNASRNGNLTSHVRNSCNGVKTKTYKPPYGALSCKTAARESAKRLFQ